MSELVFWQNIPSFHQAPLIRAVARQWSGNVLVVTEEDIPESRLQQGWRHPDFSPARLVIAPADKERGRLVAEYGRPGAIHIFSGFHAYPKTYSTLKQVSRLKATIGVYAEPRPANGGFMDLLRRIRYWYEAICWRQKFDFLLATGELGVRWYSQCGFPEANIYPFGYFVESESDNRDGDRLFSPLHDERRTVRFLFVGQLIPRKGVDLLLRSLSKNVCRNWQLDIIGDGPQKGQYKILANEQNIQDSIHWLGVLSNEVVRAQMARADALILPSRFDGWGAVVNESLTTGTPVILSDACGACDLVGKPWRGQIFRSGSVESLHVSISKVIKNGPLPAGARACIRSWARDRISPDIVAKYLLDIIGHVEGRNGRPTPPWRREISLSGCFPSVTTNCSSEGISNIVKGSNKDYLK